MMKLAWGRKVDSNFRNQIINICAEFKWSSLHASWLMSCIAFESAETFSPSIKNAAGSGATGLIQFMPSTAKGLGTTTKDLAKMTAVDQLEFVKEYFRPYARRIETLSDMYMAILLPKYIGKPESEVLFTLGNTSYRQNSGLDINSDGIITKSEATSKVQEKLTKGMRAGYSI